MNMLHRTTLGATLLCLPLMLALPGCLSVPRSTIYPENVSGVVYQDKQHDVSLQVQKVSSTNALIGIQITVDNKSSQPWALAPEKVTLEQLTADYVVEKSSLHDEEKKELPAKILTQEITIWPGQSVTKLMFVQKQEFNPAFTAQLIDPRFVNSPLSFAVHL